MKVLEHGCSIVESTIEKWCYVVGLAGLFNYYFYVTLEIVLKFAIRRPPMVL